MDVHQRGFTLLELLIAVVVASILVTVGLAILVGITGASVDTLDVPGREPNLLDRKSVV